MQQENRTNMDWKPNAHTIAWTGNETWDSLVQSGETRFRYRLTCGPYSFLGKYIFILLEWISVQFDF